MLIISDLGVLFSLPTYSSTKLFRYDLEGLSDLIIDVGSFLVFLLGVLTETTLRYDFFGVRSVISTSLIIY